jgi:large subunit ribosomal protein L13
LAEDEENGLGTEPEEAPKPARARAAKREGPSEPAPTVVDASGLVLGRAASLIAKRLLRGERIVVVNAEKSVVVGSRVSVLEHYRAARARGSVRSGPHFPRYPDRIFRRTVRGMLPHLKTRGRQALDRLEVHMGRPAPYTDAEAQSLEPAKARPALARPLTLEEITRLLGARI